MVAQVIKGLMLSGIGLLALAGCGGGGGSGGESTGGSPVAAGTPVAASSPAPTGSGSSGSVSVSGSVGDGPAVGARLVFTDATGAVIERDFSSETADYELNLAADTRLPVLVTATGGTDLVTDRALDFPLIGAVLNTGRVTVNVSPLTTLAVRAAQCSTRGLDGTSLLNAWSRIYARRSFGLDETLVADPMSRKVTDTNVGTLVLSNEVLGEAVRRTMAAMDAVGQAIDGGEILRQVGCDLMGSERTGAVSDRVMATFLAAELAVRLEAMAGRLEVDGRSATARLDASIRHIRGKNNLPSVADLPIRQSARLQTQTLLGGWLDRLAHRRLIWVAQAVAHAPAASLRNQLNSLINPTVGRLLRDLPNRAASGDTTAVSSMVARIRGAEIAAPPSIALHAAHTQVRSGGATTLTWSTERVEACVASGGWSGDRETSGSQRVSGIDATSTYQLTCAGIGGVAQHQVTVKAGSADIVNTQPATSLSTSTGATGGSSTGTSSGNTSGTGSGSTSGSGATGTPGTGGSGGTTTTTPAVPAPTVSLSAAATTVTAGQSTTLTWQTTDADTCTASGGWSGTRGPRGSQRVGPLQQSTTFNLACAGEGGNAMAMISITVNGRVALRWQPPTKNADGSRLQGLSGYRVHYGFFSGRYTDSTRIGSQTGNTHELALPPGTYYIAMTAIGTDGSESEFSNEIVRVVN